MPHQTTVTLKGTLVGKIWMPAAECTKPVTLDRRHDFNYFDKVLPTARDMVLRATNDGDFQSCNLTADSYFEFERAARRGSTLIRRSRIIPVTAFPSIADCIDSRESCEMGPDNSDEE